VGEVHTFCAFAKSVVTMTSSRYRLTVPLVLAAGLNISDPAAARIWTDSTGRYTVEADLIAFNDDMIVLQRKDHELGAVPTEQLSEADQKFLASKEAQAQTEKVTGAMQTWTLRGGTKLVGRLVGYARRDLTLQRRRGNIYVNDRSFENLPEIYQLMLPKIVAYFEDINEPDKAGLEAWLVRQKGLPRSFTIDGVTLEMENGDEYVVPFFMFSQADLKLLEPGWSAWLAAHGGAKYDEQNQQAFLLQSLAAARQRDQQVQRRIAMMQLNELARQTTLEAVQSGVTSVWEVTLYPGGGVAGPPRWVVVAGRDSLEAKNRAMSQHRGYIAGPIRRVSRF
jgi:hypothetical protein